MRVPLNLITLLIAATSHADTIRPLLPLPGTAPRPRTAAAPDPAHFIFVVSGDNRSAGRDIPQPPTPGQIFRELNVLQPALVLWTGDSIYGSDDTVGEAEAEYDAFLSLAAACPAPVYNAPGNHEIFDRAELESLYERKMGRLYGSFDYGNSHFVALDTEELGLKGGIGKEQMHWLETDLASNKKAAHIFAFMHHPLFGKDNKETWADSANRDAVHEIFKKYRVGNIFCGHEHLYYKSVHDGLNYYVTGGAGAPSDAAPEEGGFQHFMLFEVDGQNVTATVLQPWRAFVNVGPVGPAGECTAVASNYNNNDLAFSVYFPENALNDRVSVAATMVYKSKKTPVDALLVPSIRPGVRTVRVIVKAHRSVFISLRPATPSRAAKR